MSPHAARPVRQFAGGMLGVIGSEWTKMWSLRATYLLALGAAVLMAVATYQVATNHPPATDGGAVDVSRPSVSAVVVVLLVVVCIAMTSVTSEYATGSISATLLWVPRRHQVVIAKAAVVMITTLMLGFVLTGIGTIVAATTLTVPSRFELANAVTTAVVLSCYLTVASLFTLGLALMLRSAVGTLTMTALVLLGVPAALGEPYSPGGAGLAFLTGGSPDLGAGGSLLLLVAWSAGALLLGTRMLTARDA